MSTEKEDTEWKDIGNGVMYRSLGSFKVPDKPFSMDDLKNTWHLSMPDGKGNVTNTFGRWVDGKMVEDFKETIPDPLQSFYEKIKPTNAK